MKINSIYGLILLMLSLVAVNSCGKKAMLAPGDPLKISFNESAGKVMQASEETANHRRLYFSYGRKDAGFEGGEDVQAFAKVDKDALPDNLRSKFWGVAFQNAQGETLYTTLLDKSYYYRSLDENPDYYVVNYSGVFFIDIPLEMNLTGTKVVQLVDLTENKVAQSFPIDDITKAYVNPFHYEEGWTGQKMVYKIFGNTDAAQAFDFVILTEGFSATELQMQTKQDLMNSKFGGYVKKYILPLLDTEPYKSKKDKINLWVVATPSIDSGVSNPFQSRKKRTTYRATFGANCTQRSLVVRDQERALKMASLTPFDQAIVLVNDETYGGQGSDIATFSVNQRAPYLIKHELAHAVGLMADEYKYLSDTRAHSECQDSLMESYATHNRKNWGRNRYFEEEQYLAPNLSNHSMPEQVKWSKLLTWNSPVVRFDYPKKDTKLNKEEKTLSGYFKTHYDRNDLLITMGLMPSLNKILASTTELTINGQAVDFETIKMKSGHHFLIIHRATSSEEELQIQIRFSKANKAQIEWLSNFTASYHLLTLPSQVFEGTVEEMGVFQGSNVDPYKTYRSSYINIMNSSSEMGFDKWQIEAYGNMIDYYIQMNQAQ